MSTLLDLTRMDKIPVEFTLDGMRALRRNEETDQINLQELMRKQAYEQQMDPLRIQQQQLANQRSGQLLGEGEYSLATMGRKDQMERDLFGTTQQAKLKELLASASDNDAKMFENELYNRARQARPGTPEHSAAMKALEFTRGAIEEKRKSDLALRATHANNATQIKLEQMRIDAGKYVKQDRFKLSFQEELARAKNAVQVAALLRKYSAAAATDPDYAPLIPFLQHLAQTNASAYDAEVPNTGQKPGDIDLGATAPGIRTAPPRPVVNPAEGLKPPVPAASSAAPAPAPTQPSAMPKTPDEAKAAGWKLMRDKNGNRAYVGPDGKFIEVK